MLLSDSQMSMRPLCLDLLLKPIDYIIVTCLMKCLSWLVGVQSSPCSTNCIYFLILLLYFSSESVIKSWEVTWAGPEKMAQILETQAQHWAKNVLERMLTHDVGVSRASWMHLCPYQGSVQGFNGLKT